MKNKLKLIKKSLKLAAGKIIKSKEDGSISAKYESGNKSSAIGYDKVGGWSYGKHQIATGWRGFIRSKRRNDF